MEARKEILSLIIAGVTDGFEPLCSFWESNPGLMEEQSVFVTTEPSFQPVVLQVLNTASCCAVQVV